VYRHKAEVSAYACAYACVVSSICPVYFSSLATLRLPSTTTLAIPSQPTHTGREVSRPAKSHSYRQSGRTESTHRCCYKCYHGWRRGSVVRALGLWLATFPDMCLIYGWRMTTSWVRRPLWVNQPGQLSLLSLWGR